MNRDLPLISPHIKTMFKMIYGNNASCSILYPLDLRMGGADG